MFTATIDSSLVLYNLMMTIAIDNTVNRMISISCGYLIMSSISLLSEIISQPQVLHHKLSINQIEACNLSSALECPSNKGSANDIKGKTGKTSNILIELMNKSRQERVISQEILFGNILRQAKVMNDTNQGKSDIMCVKTGNSYLIKWKGCHVHSNIFIRLVSCYLCVSYLISSVLIINLLCYSDLNLDIHMSLRSLAIDSSSLVGYSLLFSSCSLLSELDCNRDSIREYTSCYEILCYHLLSLLVVFVISEIMFV